MTSLQVWKNGQNILTFNPYKDQTKNGLPIKELNRIFLLDPFCLVNVHILILQFDVENV